VLKKGTYRQPRGKKFISHSERWSVLKGIEEKSTVEKFSPLAVDTFEHRPLRIIPPALTL